MAVAIDKYTCPFCGQKALFIGVHDDEANYKGRLGCEYELDPWGGLYYGIRHDGWGDCILCADDDDLPLGGCFFDTAEEAFQAIFTLTQPKDKNVPTNEPLTLKELSQCNDPVWIKRIADRNLSDSGWAIVEGPRCLTWFNGIPMSWEIRVWWPGSEVADYPKHEDYGKTWLAYRRPLEGEV